jgi:N-ethylmaleimide reductase
MDEIAPAQRTLRAVQARDTDALFQPYRLGPFHLPHRIVMAPLTRSRARQPGNVPSSLAACYYAQRASAALIVSEATQISMQGQGYAWTPGIHSPEQVEAWRRITKAVHEADGLIFNQLWHVGRISHPALQPDNMLPVAPSAITPAGKAFIENDRGEGELVPFVRPRALTIEEIPYLIGQYERAAKNAQAAHFDGVEIHAANGYLLDQFIETGTNQRTDAYGGSVANRTQLLFEAAEALLPIWGPDRIGVRISPLGKMNDIHDDDPEATFGTIAERLNHYRLAYFAHGQPGAGANAERKGAGSGGAQHGQDDPEEIQGHPDRGGRFSARHRGAMASRRQGGFDRFRPKIHRQPRPSRAVARWRCVQHRRSDDVLRRRRERIHRLSFAGSGPRRAAESLRRSALEVSRASTIVSLN